MGLGPEDVVAEYYQQQGEMLEGFCEMDALSERGFLPGMSKVCVTGLRVHSFINYSNKHWYL